MTWLIFILVPLGLLAICILGVWIDTTLWKKHQKKMKEKEPNPYSNNKEKPFDIHRGKNFYTDEFRNFN